MRKILVIRLSSLGDIILTSPTVLNLRLRYPIAEICYLTKESFANIAGALPGVDRVVSIPAHAKFRETLDAALALDDEAFDLIVDLSANARSRLMTILINATEKVSYSKSRFLRERIVRSKKLNPPALHTIDSYNLTLRKLDSGFPLCAKRPLINKSFYQRANSCLPPEIAKWIENREEIVLISPGARHETKRAPLELFEAACEKLLQESSVKIISAFQSAEGELSLASKFKSDRFAEIVDIPLDTLAHVLSHSQVALCNDSAVAHLSSAVGTPVVALFGPTHSALGFSPRGLYDKVIENDENCRPCSLHGSKLCYREKRYCFTKLAPDEISQALLDALRIRQGLSPALFLDRDGTIIEEKNFLTDLSEVVLYESAFDNLRSAQENGYKLVIITNQSGVARGYMSEDNVRQVNQKVVDELSEAGIKIDGVYYAPSHHDGVVGIYRTADNGRKPGEEMFVKAALELHIDLRRSWVIGDRASDYLSAKTIGAAGGALVKTGYGAESSKGISSIEDLRPDLIAADLAEAISEILIREEEG